MAMKDHLFGRKRAYLDWASAAPVGPRAQRAFTQALVAYGNPSSPHAEGAAAREVLEASRTRIARLAGVKPRAVVFTSGATEANALAIQGRARALRAAGMPYGKMHLLFLGTMHSSVTKTIAELVAQGRAGRGDSSHRHGYRPRRIRKEDPAGDGARLRRCRMRRNGHSLRYAAHEARARCGAQGRPGRARGAACGCEPVAARGAYRAHAPRRRSADARRAEGRRRPRHRRAHRSAPRARCAAHAGRRAGVRPAPRARSLSRLPAAFAEALDACAQEYAAFSSRAHRRVPPSCRRYGRMRRARRRSMRSIKRPIS